MCHPVQRQENANFLPDSREPRVTNPNSAYNIKNSQFATTLFSQGAERGEEEQTERPLDPDEGAGGGAGHGCGHDGCAGRCQSRVTLVVEYFGWVDVDLGCSTILLGQ